MIEKIQQRTGGVLEDIVETIQESQLDIIESDPRQICIVQGCVGSGKSTVAIHKLSHVFFNFPKYIRPSRSILVAKNQILVGYLSTLFPKLGIFDINYKTLRDLVVNLIFREELKIHYNLDKEEDTSSIDIDYIKKLNEEINKIHIQVKDVIENIFTDEDLSTFGGYKYSDTMTPYENVTDLISDLEEELSMQKEKLKNNPKSVKSWIFKENVNNLRKIIRKLYRVRTSIKDSNLKSVLRTVNIDIKKELGYLQTLLYLFVYSELVGIKKVQKYEYCVIDEGQDFSSIEYAVLSKFVLRGRFAIFGDLNQSIETDGIGDWTKIEEVIKDASRASVFKLETNYRSTKPIIDYANVILNKYTDNNLPKSINRKGIDPAENIFNNDSDLTTKIKDEIDEDLKNLDKSIGIITFSDKYFDELSEYLRQKDNKNILILDKDKVISYIPKGMYLMKSDDCKGLEFSKVYVVGKNIKKINNFFDAKKAFVAVTRAMNELNVYWKN
jgi:DNA helicase-2/ATP-dependent DNA helicase PcrA